MAKFMHTSYQMTIFKTNLIFLALLGANGCSIDIDFSDMLSDSCLLGPYGFMGGSYSQGELGHATFQNVSGAFLGGRSLDTPIALGTIGRIRANPQHEIASFTSSNTDIFNTNNFDQSNDDCGGFFYADIETIASGEAELIANDAHGQIFDRATVEIAEVETVFVTPILQANDNGLSEPMFNEERVLTVEVDTAVMIDVDADDSTGRHLSVGDGVQCWDEDPAEDWPARQDRVQMMGCSFRATSPGRTTIFAKIDGVAGSLEVIVVNSEEP